MKANGWPVRLDAWLRGKVGLGICLFLLFNLLSGSCVSHRQILPAQAAEIMSGVSQTGEEPSCPEELSRFALPESFSYISQEGGIRASISGFSLDFVPPLGFPVVPGQILLCADASTSGQRLHQTLSVYLI